MGIFADFRKNRAVKSYIRKLPRLLAKDYGKSKTYTPKQVRSTIERSGLSAAYACYAVAMFSGREAFDRYHQEIGESCYYDMMREDLADKHFGGNSDFGIADVASVSSSYGDGDGDGGFSDAGGGDGGGGD